MPWTLHVSQELDKQSRYPLIIGVGVGMTSLMLIVVGLRLFVRKRSKTLGTDDYVTFATAMATIVYVPIIIAQTRYGLGLPVALRPKQSLDTYTKLNLAGRPFYNTVITGFKAAACFAYLRLLETSSRRRYRAVILVVLAITVLSHIAIILSLIFYCQPVQKAWQPTVQGSCLAIGPLYYGTAGVTIMCDLLVFALPIPLLISLHMSKQKKISLVIVFLLGLLTTVCSTLRLLTIGQVNKDGDATMLLFYALFEVNVGIISTSIPALIPLLRRAKAQSPTWPSKSAEPYGTHRSRDVMSNGVYLGSLDGTRESGATDQHSLSSSRENILGSVGHDVSKITRTVDVDVSRTRKNESWTDLHTI